MHSKQLVLRSLTKVIPFSDFSRTSRHKSITTLGSALTGSVSTAKGDFDVGSEARTAFHAGEGRRHSEANPQFIQPRHAIVVDRQSGNSCADRGFSGINRPELGVGATDNSYRAGILAAVGVRPHLPGGAV